MTIENTIKTLYEIAPSVDGFKNYEDFKKVIEMKSPYVEIPIIRLANLVRELEAEQRRQGAKSSGKGNPMKIAEKILKRGAKIKEALGYAEIDGDYQYISDSYLCICYDKGNHLPLEPMPKNILPIGCERFFPQAKGEPIELPDLKALKNYIKMQKALNKSIKGYTVVFDFGVGRNPFDAQLLAEIMEMLPNAKAEIVGYQLMFKDEQGNKGLLCGVRAPASHIRRRTEI